MTESGRNQQLSRQNMWLFFAVPFVFFSTVMQCLGPVIMHEWGFKDGNRNENHEWTAAITAREQTGLGV